MLKIALLSSALVLPFAAQAADLPVRSAAPAPAPLAYSWQGAYVGGTIGFATANFAHVHSYVASSQDYSSHDSRFNSFVGGVHAGYNWQTGNIVYGVEADVAAARLRGGFTEPNPDNASTTAFRSSLMATLRGRVGLAFDRTLVYGTAGLSYTKAKVTSDAEFNGADSHDFNKFGVVVGAGVEQAITNNVSVRLEGLYHFYSQSLSWSPEKPESIKMKDVLVGRTGVSFKF